MLFRRHPERSNFAVILNAAIPPSSWTQWRIPVFLIAAPLHPQENCYWQAAHELNSR